MDLCSEVRVALAKYQAALEEGTAGNDLTVEVQDASEGEKEETFKLVVKRGTKVEESYDNLTTKKGKQNAVTVVNAQSKLIRLEETTAGAIEVVSKGAVSLSG